LYAALLGLLTVLLSGSEQADAAPSVRSMTIEQRLIVRVPVRPRLRGHLHWEEVDYGPKCLPVGAIAGASLAGPDGIDFVLRNRQRVRAKLDDDCGGLDFYDGFYVQPQDRRVCARRDSISSRVGRTCEINRFRMLVPRLEGGE
jgi:hypothetical protein